MFISSGTTYFGFAIADSMFPETCKVTRTTLRVDEVINAKMCLNPSHAAIARFNLPITIPKSPPRVILFKGDVVIVMSVRGLPRLENRHEYTQQEIDNAIFVFGEWKVED